MKPKIICVVPTIRPESMAKFREAWHYLFDKHEVTLITIWDGERPRITYSPGGSSTEMDITHTPLLEKAWTEHRDLFCRFTDSVRNLGFVAAAAMGADFIFTADDDIAPVSSCDCPAGQWKDEWDDPIQAHLDALNKRVCTSWMSMTHDTDLHLRGEPYSTREESPVMLSHGVWVGVPDFDGETQLELEGAGDRIPAKNNIPYSLPYHVGPIPRGIPAALCGMNLMVRKEALPYLYFAPMGPDSGVIETCNRCKGYGLANCGLIRTSGASATDPCPRCKGTGTTSSLHRFGDIWMGVFLKQEFDRKGWAVYTGASTIHHTRASDAKKNFEQERLGREWNEIMYCFGENVIDNPNFKCLTRDIQFLEYFHSYADKRKRYAELIQSLQEQPT